ncbi:MAG TPA: sodium:proton exchanger [Campylobacteraceae bacterium]|jgi:Ca2+:H+ antiporter|nr:sodium:proton exchanger [Campylobacteraceae bacterium]
MDSHSNRIEAHSEPSTFLENYWDIFGGILLAIVAYYFHIADNPAISTIFSALAIISLSITVSEVADILAERLDEPYGSFVLTFTAVAVEIILLFNIMLQVSTTPAAMQTVQGGIISAVIVDMNVLLGLAVFIGGLSFSEQQHNEDTSSSYTTILYVASLGLLVPSILGHSGHSEKTVEQASYIIGFLLFFFYLTILIFQTKTHIHFFKATAKSRIFRYKRRLAAEEGQEIEEHENYIFEKLPTLVNFIVIFLLIFLIGVLAEIFAHDGMHEFKSLGLSAGLAGLTIAIISVAPEIFTAVKAAKNDQIQRVINIAMGASTVSILLTVPSLLVLGYIAGVHLPLNFNPLEIGALIFTIILAWKTTDDGETNYFEGISHLMLFLCYAVIAALY